MGSRNTKRELRTRLALVGGLLAIATIAALATATAPVAGQGAYTDLYMPLAMSGSEMLSGQGEPPFVPTLVPPTVTSTSTPLPTATNTLPPTDGPTATEGPLPTPTLPGAPVTYPTDPDTIVMQIGWTATDQIGEVWEEMNGTPWFTLYGDGRLIAGHTLFDRKQELFDGQVDDYRIQLWLRHLTYDVGFFTLKRVYAHPRSTKPILHFYVNTRGGYRRVSLQGFRRWETHEAPDEPDRANVVMLAQFARSLEEYVADRLENPYSPTWYTILAQKVNPKMLDTAPRWQGKVNVAAIAAAAPTAASNYVDKVVGHKFVKADLGKEVQDYVVPFADEMFPFSNRAGYFSAGGRHHSVGARQEVPGGSQFLPDQDRSFWYRSDPGSGRPPLADILEERMFRLREHLFSDRETSYRRE